MFYITEKEMMEVERIKEAQMKNIFQAETGIHIQCVLGLRTDTCKISNTEIQIKLSPVHLTPRREINTVQNVTSTGK